MTIPIIYEDDVDWEPLVIRFVDTNKLSKSKAVQLATFVLEWMNSAAESDADLWRMAKEWNCKVSDNGDVVAYCEFIPDTELTRLSIEVHEVFPTLKEMRLGYRLSNPATIDSFDWFTVSANDVQLGEKTYDVASFTISFTPVTVGQFQQFLEATKYIPVPDKIQHSPGYLIEHFKLNFGPSPKQVLFGVTHDDAVAFCEWASCRLPTDAELKLFFHTACTANKKFQYSGECWTSTSTSKGKYATWNGPYRKDSLSEPDRNYRKLLPQHQYEFLEAPCFRMVRRSAT